VSVVVYRYGTPSWIKLPEVVGEQLFLAHNLREDLVSLEHDTDAARKRVWSSFPAVAAAETTLTSAEERAEELAEQVAELKKQQRTRAPKGQPVTDLAEARKTAKAARKARREAIVAAKPQAQPQLDEITAAYRAQVKALYRDYVQTRGLYWAVHNDVLDHHRTAVKRVAARRAAGHPAQLQHHRFDGSGALAVQLQRGKDQPPRTPELLASGEGPWRNVLQIAPWKPPEQWAGLSRAEQRHHARGTVRVRIGAEHVELPVIVHRMLPPDADVTGARLVVERIAGQRRVSLHVTAKIADAEPVATGPMVAVHGGWRREDDDAIRVATYRASEPITAPQHLETVVRPVTDQTGIVVLPADWAAAMERSNQLRSERDAAMETMRAALLDWLRTHPQPNDAGPTVREVAAWRSPLRLAKLALAWREQPPASGQDIAAQLERWRAQDRRRWETQEHGRRKHLARRDDTWRRVAAWLTNTASRVVVEDTDYAALTRAATAADAESGLPTEVTARAARQRVHASPGGLRDTLRTAAEARGVPVTVVASQDLTREHTCGYVHDTDTPTRPVTCRGCGRTYDPDNSATMLMLNRASGAAAPPTDGTARDTA
jgi:hypothetical protein